MRDTRLIRVAALLLCCLSSVLAAQDTAGRRGRGAAVAAGAAIVATVPVPRVIGQSLSVAMRLMTGANLQCGAKNLGGGNPLGGDSVVRQTPGADQRVPFTTPCTLYVVTPPPPQVARTPNVMGRSFADATTTIKRAELRPVFKPAPSRDTALGSVIGQDPSPGAPIRPDRSIEVTIAGVPDVITLSLSDAASAIQRAHLRVGSVDNRELSAGINDAVLDQVPAAGQLARPQTAVSLTVARVIPRAIVPALVGQQVNRAVEMLTAVGLDLGRIDSADSPRPVGEIVRQSISADSRVPPKTTVGVTVARAPRFAMPDLIGRTIADARAVTEKNRLRITRFENAKAEGRPDTVVGQTPVAGAAVSAGDAVVIVAGRAIAPPVVAQPPVVTHPPVTTQPAATQPPVTPPPAVPQPVVVQPPVATQPTPVTAPPPTPGFSASVLVPDFVKTPVDHVSRLPGVDSLRVVVRRTSPKDGERELVVTAQSIAAGTRVAVGTAVELTVPQRQNVRVVRLTVLPESTSVATGKSVRLTALAQLSDGTQSEVSATWRVSDGSITGDGVFVAGSTVTRVTVTASSGTVSGTAVIEVVRANPTWWLVALVAAVLAGIASGARIIWQRTHPPEPVNPPPPLVFTYKPELQDSETAIQTSGGHGVDLAIVSSAGDSEQTIEPRGVKLFDEERYP